MATKPEGKNDRQNMPVSKKSRARQLENDRKRLRQEQLVAALAECGLRVNGHDRTRDREVALQMPQYAKLIRATAIRIEHVVEESREDIEQILWINCHKALMRYDPSRLTMPRDAYVANCIIRRKIDILRADKSEKRKILYIEDMYDGAWPESSGERGGPGQDRTKLKYLSVEAEAIYAEIERELPLIPSTLTHLERHILVLLYDDYTPQQIQTQLGVKRAEVKEALDRIQIKFADFKPDVASPGEVMAA